MPSQLVKVRYRSVDKRGGFTTTALEQDSGAGPANIKVLLYSIFHGVLFHNRDPLSLSCLSPPFSRCLRKSISQYASACEGKYGWGTAAWHRRAAS